ncbi:MAG TPA: hypothetical protein VK128_01745 [Steroidobacteraceae bacterium]|nr:hypothetical protein [Steroidobacteraceae bacterium]
MDLDDFQRLAQETDQFAERKRDAGLMIPLLGLSGEVGTLLAEFKKKIRDKGRYEGFSARAKEEMGDILWYLANVASRIDLRLSEIAAQNLVKTQERWPLPGADDRAPPFDLGYPASERLPRALVIEISEAQPRRTAAMRILVDGVTFNFGDPLTDNSYDDDGYRYHDVLHLAHLAVLGWSPVLRKLLGRKRRSKRDVDEVEDGARAMIVEEAVVAFVYANAELNGFYEHTKHVDSDMLATVKQMVRPFEVSRCIGREWERAILLGYRMFRRVRAGRGGRLALDLDAKTMHFTK